MVMTVLLRQVSMFYAGSSPGSATQGAWRVAAFRRGALIHLDVRGIRDRAPFLVLHGDEGCELRRRAERRYRAELGVVARISGVLSPSFSAALSLSTMAADVPAGATMPLNVVTS